ncbi:MAG: lamin tail domain-containing protein [Candidatus Omnitrophota bacterium]
MKFNFFGERKSNSLAFALKPLFYLGAMLLAISAIPAQGQVIINEIHYNPDVKTDLVEFVELYNAGAETANLTGWSFRYGIDFTFPESSILAAGEYRVVAEDKQAVQKKYKIASSKIWGPFTGRLENEGEIIELCDAEGRSIDRVEYVLGFPWPTVGDAVPETNPGSGHSIQLVNPGLDNDLGGSWRSAYPSPGARNSVFAENIPPQIRQVKHDPEGPASGQEVTITAKATDPDGVASVTLSYQIVDPGHYIFLSDAEYKTNWEAVEMRDDGARGDAAAGDSVYTCVLPGSLQRHRRLLRYRIAAADKGGLSIQVPYADDPQPNFAYFVYDGVPDWIGSIRPGTTQEISFPSAMLNSLPIYQLITSKTETEKCTWLDQSMTQEYLYSGTFVYGTDVYDHIRFRARGGTWRFSMGKNMWKFNFTRGHSFQARDDYGRKYKTQWDRLNLGANIQQGDYLHRGEQGMFEAVGFKLMNMAGIETANTNYVHFRIIDEENEDGRLNGLHSGITTSGTQYDGDFWGLYLATEQMDGRFLDEHGLPDSNFYKMENGTGELSNEGPNGPSDLSDMYIFMSGYYSKPTEQWWRNNVDLQRYYGYRTILEAIHHYDNGYGKNYYYYYNPLTKLWSQHPWDLDLTWANNMFGNGNEPFKAAGLLNNIALKIEYQNRHREIMDLLFNPSQTNQLIDEIASFIYTPGQLSFVDADRAMWDYHWVMGNKAARYRGHGNKAGQGMFYQIAPTKDFAGMLQLMKDYVVSRGAWMEKTLLKDSNIPDAPVIVSTSPENYPIDSLTFETTPFGDPQGENTFAALKWRIAEVDPESEAPSQPAQDPDVDLVPDLSTWKYFKGRSEPSTPASAWRELNFDDSGWEEGTAPIGYGEEIIATVLSDMRYNYSTIYLRKKFTIKDAAAVKNLVLKVLFDDGFNVWINGVHAAKDHVASEEMPFDSFGQHREDLNYIDYPISDPSRYLISGENAISVQVVNEYLGSSSDCFIDVKLVSPAASANPGNSNSGSANPAIKRSTAPRKYEIDPVWESEEMTAFQKDITIPASKVTIGHTYRVRARMKDDTGRWSRWSAPIQFTVGESENSRALLENLRIAELMFNPPGDGSEFIELHNTHPSLTLSLAGAAFTNGVEFTFPDGVYLPPNGYLVVVPVGTDEEKTAFRKLYGLNDSILLAGPYTGKLANGGEFLTLKRSLDGEEIFSLEFADGRGWPLATDGAGHSLVPLDSALAGERMDSLSYGGNWRASAFIGGSPGGPDPEPIRNVVLNEFMANTANSETGNSNDWIELYNTSQTVHLSGWHLSDDAANLKKWAIPAMDIAANGFVRFDESTGFNHPAGSGFALSKEGEQLFLSYLPGKAGVDRVVDCVQFKAQEKSLSQGRYGDGGEYWYAMEPSENAANRAGIPHIAVDEIMYHPAMDEDVNLEYIELYNPTGQTVNLWNENGSWRLDGGAAFTFPAKTALSAEGRLLVVGFNSNDAAALNAFKNVYQLSTELAPLILGPYDGKLSNQGERIALEKPLSADPVNGPGSWAIVDEAIYFHQAPWTPEADGLGKSLQRISSAVSGDDPNNWKADAPSPGRKGSPNTAVQSWMIY